MPGAHLEVDIVPEGVDPLGRGEEYQDPYAVEEEAEAPAPVAEGESEEPLAEPIATAAIDLASGARYRATGKRKTAIARVTLRPGTGTYLVNGRTLEEHFPRKTLQRNIRQPLETVGYEDRMDVVARLHGGGISAQAGALRHGVSRGAARGRPEPARRAQAPRLPDARLARQGAQEGRAEEGAQASAVLQALGRPRGRKTMARKLFGTDGVRGVAGEFLTAEMALGLARAATRRAEAERPQVLIIRDTRESGEMLEAAVAAGVSAAGGDALLGGVLPTPAAPLLLGRYGFDLAVVLSASHNPYRDNGIKFFGGDGYKLSDETELEIERALERARSAGRQDRPGARAAWRRRGLPARAAHALQRPRPVRARRAARLRQRRHLPRRAGDLQASRRLRDRPCRQPDGRNINDGCGSTHVQELAHGSSSTAATASASPSTATATACWPSTPAARSSTATSCSRSPRCTCASAGRLSGGGRGRDGDDQLRLPRGDGARGRSR